MFEYNEPGSRAVFALIKNATQNSVENQTENAVKISTTIFRVLIDSFSVFITTNEKSASFTDIEIFTVTQHI